MSNIVIEIDESKLKQLVLEYLNDRVDAGIELSDVTIEVKSKQNYRSEWEYAQFRARVAKLI